MKIIIETEKKGKAERVLRDNTEDPAGVKPTAGNRERTKWDKVQKTRETSQSRKDRNNYDISLCIAPCNILTQFE